MTSPRNWRQIPSQELQNIVSQHEALSAENVALSTEIERLKAENALLRTGDTCARHCEGVAFRHEAQRLTKDNERLREALERIKANRYGLQSLIEDGADEKTIAEYWANTVMEYQQIARAALAGDN